MATIREHLYRARASLSTLLVASGTLGTLGVHTVQPYSNLPPPPIIRESPAQTAAKLRRAAEEEQAQKQALAFCTSHAGKFKENCGQYYAILSRQMDMKTANTSMERYAPEFKVEAMEMMWKESRYNPQAISQKAATGLMGVHHPKVFRRYKLKGATELSKWQKQRIKRDHPELFDWQSNIASGVERFLEHKRIAAYVLCDRSNHYNHEHTLTPEVHALGKIFYNFGTERPLAMLQHIEKEYRTKSPRRKLEQLYAMLPDETKDYVKPAMLAFSRRF